MASRSETAAGSRHRATRMDRDARVLHILEVARESFCAHGFQGVSVADISERMGVSEATIFKYFPTKRDLLNQCIEHWYGELFGDYSQDLSVLNGARDRFRYLVWKHLKVIQGHPDMCRLMFNEVRSQPGYFESTLYRMNHRYTRLLVEVVQAGQASGEFRDDLPVLLLRDLVYGGIEHHVWMFLYENAQLDPEQTANQLTMLLCRGIEASAGQPDGVQQSRLSDLVDRLENAVDRLQSG